MIKMYRPNAVTGKFRSIEEGRKAGYYETFSEMAAAQKEKQDAPRPPVQDTVAPVPPVAAASDAPQPPTEDDATLTRAEILDYAEAHGMDTSIHHLHLRKQVEEAIHAESGSDQPGVCGDPD